MNGERDPRDGTGLDRRLAAALAPERTAVERLIARALVPPAESPSLAARLSPWAAALAAGLLVGLWIAIPPARESARDLRPSGHGARLSGGPQGLLLEHRNGTWLIHGSDASDAPSGSIVLIYGGRP